MFTHRIAELKGQAAAGAAVVCGRVVQVLPGGIVLDDGSASCTFPVEAAPGVQAGDLVALELPAPAAVAPSRIVVLGRYQGPGPFPPPGGEWYRLNRDGGQRRRNLALRGTLLGEARRFFAARGFVEIEAPLLVPSPGLELHLDAFAAGTAREAGGEAGEAGGENRYLITSPEYQLKRLLCGGLPRIYSLGKVFRRGEAGRHHNPEFTMLEWYRAWEGWEAVARDVEALCVWLSEALSGAPNLDYRGLPVDLTPPWPRMTVAEALERHAGVRLRGDEDAAELRARLAAAGHDPGGAEAWDDLFFSVFLDRVEPHLGRPAPGRMARPVVLYDWPRPLCALARPRPGVTHVVERFEAYIGGLELCNGFGELCDPVEQRRRFTADLDERRRRGLPLYPIDERFLAALEEGMPPAGGVALGVDRLLMLLLDAATIEEVLPFSAREI